VSEELQTERDFLLKSIADLDAERAAGDIDDADYTALRDDYVARAADVLRQIEGVASEPATTPRSRRGRVVVTIAASLAVALGAGVALANAAGSRSAGEAATGSLPSSVSSQLQEAGNLLQEGRAVDAVKLYDKILKRDPKQPVALAYRGWLVRLAGLKKEGLAYVDRAVQADPTYPDAHFFRGMMLWQDNADPAGGVAEFRLFLANNPPQAMVALVEDALKRASEEAGIPVQ
jgi:tetratricopeptide (TPR) repeat protein